MCGAFIDRFAGKCPLCGGAVPDPRYRAPSAPTGRDSYDRFADKVGLVPNVRARDNLFQAVFVAVTTATGAAVLGVLGGWPVGVRNRPASDVVTG